MYHDTNTTTVDHRYDCGSFFYMKAIFGSLLAIMGIFLNTSIVIVLLRQSRRSTANLLVLHLAIADLLVFLLPGLALFMSLYDSDYFLNSFICKLGAFFSRLTNMVSIYLITVITTIRSYSIRSPLSYRKHIHTSKVNRICLGVWLFSLSISLGPFFGWAEYEAIEHQCWCQINSYIYPYNWFTYLVLAFVLPLVLNTASYLFTLKRITKCRRGIRSSSFCEREAGQPIPSHRDKQQREDTEKEDKNAAAEFKLTVMNDIEGNPEITEPHIEQYLEGADVSLENSPSKDYGPRDMSQSSTKNKATTNTIKHTTPKTRLQKTEDRITLIVTLLFLVYVLFSGQFFFLWSWFALRPNSVPRIAFFIIRSSLGINSLLNPLLYGFLSKEIRAGILGMWKSLFCQCSGTCNLCEYGL